MDKVVDCFFYGSRSQKEEVVKKVIAVLSVVMVFLLSACGGVELTVENDWYELKRGSEFEMPAVLANGEEIEDYNVKTSLDKDVLGEYPMTFVYEDEEVTITVKVVKNDQDLFDEAIIATEDADSGEINLLNNIVMTAEAVEYITTFDTYMKSTDQVAYMEITQTSSTGVENMYMYMEKTENDTITSYISFDNVNYENMGAEPDEDDNEDSFLGFGFNLMYGTVVSATTEGEVTTYTVELDTVEFTDLIEMDVDSYNLVDPQVDTVTVEVQVENGFVSNVSFDLTDVVYDYFDETFDGYITLDELSYDYEVFNVDAVEDFEIPTSVKSSGFIN